MPHNPHNSLLTPVCVQLGAVDIRVRLPLLSQTLGAPACFLGLVHVVELSGEGHPQIWGAWMLQTPFVKDRHYA